VFEHVKAAASNVAQFNSFAYQDGPQPHVEIGSIWHAQQARIVHMCVAEGVTATSGCWLCSTTLLSARFCVTEWPLQAALLMA
jgi:hypothetical protein